MTYNVFGGTLNLAQSTSKQTVVLWSVNSERETYLFVPCILDICCAFSSIQRMPSCFITVPRLSTICRLDNIVPCDHSGATDWSAEAKTAFADMTSTRPMRMKVGALP